MKRLFEGNPAKRQKPRTLLRIHRPHPGDTETGSLMLQLSIIEHPAGQTDKKSVLNWLENCGDMDSVSCQLNLNSNEAITCCQLPLKTPEEDVEEIQGKGRQDTYDIKKTIQTKNFTGVCPLLFHQKIRTTFLHLCDMRNSGHAQPGVPS